MRFLATLPVLLLVLGCGQTENRKPPAPAKSLPEPGRRLLEAIGFEAWKGVRILNFTWNHAPSGRVRSYVWKIRDGVVEASRGADRAVFPADGPGPDTEPIAKELHKAFVNDVYWLAFPLVAAGDGSVWSDLGEVPVPGLERLGRSRAIAVSYGGDEGYTPGDRYVLYLGADDLPAAWAFHRGGADEPTLVTTREARLDMGGVNLPTRFLTADGKLFIEITGLALQR